jgi:hypothetical protein
MFDSQQEAARVAENAAAALKLKELQALSQLHNQKMTEQAREAEHHSLARERPGSSPCPKPFPVKRKEL